MPHAHRAAFVFSLTRRRKSAELYNQTEEQQRPEQKGNAGNRWPGGRGSSLESGPRYEHKKAARVPVKGFAGGWANMTTVTIRRFSPLALRPTLSSGLLWAALLR